MEIKQLKVGDLETNCYFLISRDGAAIIDPGGSAEIILAEIGKLSKNKKIKYIINTHYHPDHTLANKEIKNKTGAKILIHKAEENFIDFVPDKFLEEGDRIKIGDSVLKVIHTPGHTKGSICLLAEEFIFTGDTLFYEGYGRTDLPAGSQDEIEKSLEKIKKLLKPGMKVYPGHGESFKV